PRGSPLSRPTHFSSVSPRFLCLLFGLSGPLLFIPRSGSKNFLRRPLLRRPVAPDRWQTKFGSSRMRGSSMTISRLLILIFGWLIAACVFAQDEQHSASPSPTPIPSQSTEKAPTSTSDES